MQKITFTLPLPPCPFSVNDDFPDARHVLLATTASERLPECLKTAEDTPALYRFAIYAGNRVERFYVGETIHFRSRMRQYCGMIRRLLLIYYGVPKVVLEKHPMRHVQYFLANALQAEALVELEWRPLQQHLSKTQREEKEREEQKRFQGLHPTAKLIAGRADGNFETHPPQPLPPTWRPVHARLLTFPKRRTKKPPFVV